VLVGHPSGLTPSDCAAPETVAAAGAKGAAAAIIIVTAGLWLYGPDESPDRDTISFLLKNKLHLKAPELPFRRHRERGRVSRRRAGGSKSGRGR
jgi:hypothetical protein